MSTIYSNNETVNINPADDLVLYKEEFINSRIEKFLYAICALDFNDLPTPLSRIEELYKCLATGLPAPTFVPQSRVEKYLMAILGGYNTNALPAPQSRTEVLLNKILLGDTDLSDIEWLKSRYEFLLAYIAKSGETSSGPDVNYVNYSLDDALITLYNTIEYPVRSAILYGSTKYKDVDTDEILETFEEGRNLELVSVKMPVLSTTGKNLFDGTTIKGGVDVTTGEVYPYEDSEWFVSDYINVKDIKTLYFQTGYMLNLNVLYMCFDSNKKFIGYDAFYNSLTGVINLLENTHYIRLRFHSTIDFSTTQIEQGIQATSHEPFKSNNLKCNEEVTLRSNGDVYDELNLLTGRLTQRIDENNEVLAQAVVKTVDLSTLDQDGKKTKLSTFDDITHVTVSSEGLVPTGDIDIARPIQFVDYSLDNSLTTLYNTFDRPVKSAILKGNTLVNLVVDGLTEKILSPNRYADFVSNLYKQSTTYTIVLNVVTLNDTGTIAFHEYDEGTSLTTKIAKINVGINKILFTSSNNVFNQIRLRNPSAATTNLTIKNVMILEGDYTNVDIPYFEGMKSVKMPVLTTVGKNLFDEEQTPTQESGIGDNVKKVILNENTTYTYSSSPYTGNVTFRFFDCYDAEIARLGGILDKSSFVTPGGTLYAKVHTDKDSNVQIEQGSTATSYEPFKSKILTCNEEVELRRIGDIKDELNLVTGEVTQRIGEVVFDGSEDWTLSAYVNSTSFYTPLNNLVRKVDYLNSMSCDKLVVHTNESYLFNSTSPNGISGYADWTDTYQNENWIYIKYADSEGSVEKLKQWLSQNPITVQYELATESVKTVDLSTLDQDGKETELSTFDDITHVAVSSEGLVPTGEITVATKNATDVADASTMSLRMDDILNSQNTLEGSANTQSDDIDVTMLGATDIYEQLL